MMYGLPLFMTGLENWGGSVFAVVLVVVGYLGVALFLYGVLYSAIHRGMRRAILDAWREIGAQSVNIPPPPSN